MSKESSKSPVSLVNSVPVSIFYQRTQKSLHLSLVAGESGLSESIGDKTLNRPALALTGYWEYFGHKRIQLFGAGEMGYLRHLPDSQQRLVLEEMVQKHVPCLVISRGLEPTPAMQAVADAHNTPLFRTEMDTRDFAAKATLELEELFAPSTVEHGTMMDVKGIGTLIRGESGLGKSECALALIDRGYSLVADDMVHVKLLNEYELMATSAELNRNYMECRGIGIINIAELFGIGATRLQKHIDLVVTLIEWKPGMEVDRTGLEENFYTILDQEVPHIVIPVRSGRDLGQLVEVAAMVQALKMIGHHPARDFNERLIAQMDKGQK